MPPAVAAIPTPYTLLPPLVRLGDHVDVYPGGAVAGEAQDIVPGQAVLPRQRVYAEHQVGAAPNLLLVQEREGVEHRDDVGRALRPEPGLGLPIALCYQAAEGIGELGDRHDA